MSLRCAGVHTSIWRISAMVSGSVLQVRHDINIRAATFSAHADTTLTVRATVGCDHGMRQGHLCAPAVDCARCVMWCGVFVCRCCGEQHVIRMLVGLRVHRIVVTSPSASSPFATC